MSASTVSRLHLPTSIVELDDKQLTLVALPEFDPEYSIPPVSLDDDPRLPVLRGKLLVRPDKDARADFTDGMLGQPWFGGRVWTFDYVHGHMSVDAIENPVAGETIDMGFPKNESTGRRTSHFASIEAEVAGTVRPFLFDTGATVVLTETALAELRDHQPAQRATSFVAASVFEEWARKGWRVIDNADINAGGQPIIEVPCVTIAGHTVGSVWFTRRPDANFHERMSSMMDRRVDGALGGSLFKYFVVTADYRGARLTLERTT